MSGAASLLDISHSDELLVRTYVRFACSVVMMCVGGAVECLVESKSREDESIRIEPSRCE